MSLRLLLYYIYAIYLKLPGPTTSLEQQPKKSHQKSSINKIKFPPNDEKTNSFIPAAPATQKDKTVDTALPPICITVSRTEFKYAEVSNNAQLIERLKNEQLKFIIQRNFYILVKVIQCKLTITIFKHIQFHKLHYEYVLMFFVLNSSILLHKQNGHQFFDPRYASCWPGRNCYFVGG